MSLALSLFSIRSVDRSPPVLRARCAASRPARIRDVRARAAAASACAAKASCCCFAAASAARAVSRRSAAIWAERPAASAEPCSDVISFVIFATSAFAAVSLLAAFCTSCQLG